MEKARNDELYRALKEKDYPDDFCREIAYNQIRGWSFHNKLTINYKNNDR